MPNVSEGTVLECVQTHLVFVQMEGLQQND